MQRNRRVGMHPKKDEAAPLLAAPSVQRVCDATMGYGGLLPASRLGAAVLLLTGSIVALPEEFPIVSKTRLPLKLVTAGLSIILVNVSIILCARATIWSRLTLFGIACSAVALIMLIAAIMMSMVCIHLEIMESTCVSEALATNVAGSALFFATGFGALVKLACDAQQVSSQQLPSERYESAALLAQVAFLAVGAFLVLVSSAMRYSADKETWSRVLVCASVNLLIAKLIPFLHPTIRAVNYCQLLPTTHQTA